MLGAIQLKITYKTNKLEKQCTQYNIAEKAYGQNMVVVLFRRIQELKAADSIEMLIQYSVGRCHRLQGNRKHEYAMDLVHPYRLIFTKDGEIIQAVRIMAVEDYH